MITPITSKLIIHNQSLDDWEFRGGYKILFAEVLLTERISDEVIKDFLAIIIFPGIFLRVIHRFPMMYYSKIHHS